MESINFAQGSIGRFPPLEKVLKEAVDQIDPTPLLYYRDPYGMLELREEIANLHGAKVENVLITSSSQQSLNIVFEYFKNSPLIVQNPAYFGVWRILSNRERELDNKETVYYLCSNFNTSLEGYLSEEDKDSLVNQDFRIIEDNPYDLLYFGEKPSTLYERDPSKVLYLGSFSKILAPGLRLAYILAEPDELTELKRIKCTYDLVTNGLSQQVALHALRHPSYLDEFRTELKEKRDLLQNSLNNLFQEGIKWGDSQGGIFLTVGFEDVDVSRLLSIAKEHYGLSLNDDRFRYKDRIGENTTRINFSEPTRKEIVEGVKRLFSAYQEV